MKFWIIILTFHQKKSGGVVYYLKSTYRFIFSVSIVLFLSSSLAQQRFNVIIGGDSVDAALSCSINGDNSITIGGHTNSFQVQSYDLYLLKLAENGTVTWNKTYGNYGMDGIREIKSTNDNGFILGGYSGSYDLWDFLVMKVDSLGNPSWAKSIGGNYPDECLSLSQTSDNGYIAVGHTKSFASSPTGYYANYYLIKYSSTGQIQWNKVMGWDYHDWAHEVIQTKDKGFAILGYSDLGTYYVDYDIVIVKTDSLGNKLWVNAYALDGDEYALDFIETTDGGFVLAGYTVGKNIFLIKTNSNGDVIWGKRYVGAMNCYAYSINPCADGGFIIGGQLQLSTNDSDALLIRTDKDGNLLWASKYAGNRTESFGDVKQTTDLGYVAVGNTKSVGNNSVNILIIRTDSIGKSVCPSSTVSLTTQPFTPNSYHFNNFFVTSAGYISDWNFTVKNQSPQSIFSCLTDIENEDQSGALNHSLYQNYPNPFNPTTKINFSLPQRDFVTLKVFDLLGNEIATLVNEEKEAGYHEVAFDGSKLPSGIYIYTIITDGFSASKKLMLIK